MEDGVRADLHAARLERVEVADGHHAGPADRRADDEEGRLHAAVGELLRGRQLRGPAVVERERDRGVRSGQRRAGERENASSATRATDPPYTGDARMDRSRRAPPPRARPHSARHLAHYPSSRSESATAPDSIDRANVRRGSRIQASLYRGIPASPDRCGHRRKDACRLTAATATWYLRRTGQRRES